MNTITIETEIGGRTFTQTIPGEHISRENLETVMVGRGTEVHFRRDGSRFPMCGQTNMRSGIRSVSHGVTCKGCMKKGDSYISRINKLIDKHTK